MTSTLALAGAEARRSPRDQRIGHVHAVDRDCASRRTRSARPSCCSARTAALYRPPWHDDADIGRARRQTPRCSLCSRMNATRRRPAHVDLVLLLRHRSTGGRLIRPKSKSGRLDAVRASSSGAARFFFVVNVPCTWQARIRSSSITGVFDASGQLEAALDHLDDLRQVRAADRAATSAISSRTRGCAPG